MKSQEFNHLASADLMIDLSSGKVESRQGGIVRLGPVNLKVLETLLMAEGAVVGRSEVFDRVWPNQEIHDDVLTRNISDLRATLGRLSSENSLIETIPKKGYRWLHPVTPTDTSTQAQNSGPRKTFWTALHPILRWAPAYLLGVELLLSCIVWLTLTLQGSAENQNAIAVLEPQVSSNEFLPVATQYQEALIMMLIKNPDISVLSQAAVNSQAGVFYPGLHMRYGTIWVIEINFHEYKKNELQLIVSLVDARSAYLLSRQTSIVQVSKNEVTELASEHMNHFLGVIETANKTQQ